MKKWVPFVLFIGLSILLWAGLFHESAPLAPQINKSAPDLDGTELKGEIYVVNFWATWCPPCRQEHAALLDIARLYPIQLIGVNYKDHAADALQWLNDLGNPYSIMLADPDGRIGMDWGVIAVPETFIVDAMGIVRYKHAGVVTKQQWENEIWPFIETLF